MLELLHIYAPRFLQVPACLVIDAGQSAIYLVEQSQQVPAFWVYCAGCTSLQRAKKLATSVAENGTDSFSVRTKPGEYEREAVI